MFRALTFCVAIFSCRISALPTYAGNPGLLKSPDSLPAYSSPTTKKPDSYQRDGFDPTMPTPMPASSGYYLQNFLFREECLRLHSGWPDWATYHKLGYFWRHIVIFLKRWRSPKKWRHFGLFFTLAKLHFHLNKQFQNMICCKHLKVSKFCRYFGIFWFADCLGYSLKNWAIFFQIFWSPTKIVISDNSC